MAHPSGDRGTRAKRRPRPRSRLTGPPTRRPLWVGRVILVTLTLALTGILGRVAQLQTDPPSGVLELIDTQRSGTRLLGRRGNLVDRQGRPMATTRTAKRLFADPLLIQDIHLFAQTLAQHLDYDAGELEAKLRARLDSRYVVLDPRLSDERVEKIEGLRLDGMGVQDYLVRDYPMGLLGGQVLGFVGHDGEGLEGMERTLNEQLQGMDGTIRYWRDVRRQPIWAEDSDYRAPRDGAGIRLSLDATLQAIAEEELQQACEDYLAESGQAIVMDPLTGEILAMANYPFFNPNFFPTASPEQWRNRCVTDAVEPGSTFKPYIWAAALDAGVTRPGEMFDCTESGYYVFFGRRALRDAHANGELTLEGVLIQSSNIGMGFLGERLGKRRLFEAVRNFGFGEPTGSNLPGEIAGIVNPLKQWNDIYSVTSVPMGQEVAVTPLQLTRALAVVANDGWLVTPTLLAREPDHWESEAPFYDRVLSDQAARHTRHTMHQVMTEGTGRRAASDKYPIFGKTGTAQVPDRVHGGYLHRQYTAAFVGGAPVERPRLVVTVIVHRPDPDEGYYGGVVAAPVGRDILDRSLLYLGVPPMKAEDEAPVAVR